ncbi:STAS domain-containing protein [Novosphingobium sp. ERN07]|uniref:STAS domain-containing protein n=1 Tax=Novosphingobium sp. ERN07 TaxID=2726187 RepID=UPI00145643FE|nr:STAS domain-containing protein [Novosphingobium sp. ERN07]NLR73171.1 STAS domain-containing protein [Novosphingobium sp. ERN07]
MVVVFGESANIRAIEGIRTTLLEAFQLHDDLELDVSQVAEADLSFLQLIEAARKFAATEGKRIRLTAPATASLAALLDRAGILAGDPAGIDDFWLKGDVQ